MNKIPPIDAPHTIRLIEDFIRTRVTESGTKGVIIGLSGGIDSAVVASIAVRALKPKNVLTFFLPSATTPSSDIGDVKSLCSQLGVKLTEINIQKLIDRFSEEVQEKEDSSILRWANFKPRIRQAIFYFYANRFNYLVCGAGNKSEIMIGYFTKFGDGAVDILPIGDVYKTHVMQLGKYLNIPDCILTKAPSAGLWEGQTDEAEIGMSYLQLDNILYGLERFQTEVEVADYLQIPITEVKRVRSMLYQSEHKRRGPLIFKLGIRTPNIDWRIPLVKPSDV
ncbi:MAG: NAD+ synthase [Candidatus Heimdallarchaeota archaeon]|nr:MAG: NAD+ synthase [Candidatus Heimdallarchaeota archaeon]